MIPFRYLVVGIAVVILALAAGILLGGTLIDPVTATRLERQVQDLSKRVARYRTEISKLEQAAGTTRSYVEDTLPALVQGRLSGAEVLLMIDQKVDPSASQAARQALTEAGATLVGVIEVLPRLGSSDPGDRSALAEILGLDPNDPPADLSARASQAVATRLEVPAPAGDDLLQRLAEGGFIAMPQLGPEGIAGIGGSGQAIVVLAGGADEPAVPPDAFLVPLIGALEQGGAPVPVVAAERTDTVAPFVALLRQGALDGRATTVDDLDEVFGQFSLVVGLADQLTRPGIGRNYGSDPGADAPYPSP